MADGRVWATEAALRARRRARREVRCPICGAPKRKHCLTQKGSVTELVHRERVQAIPEFGWWEWVPSGR